MPANEKLELSVNGRCRSEDDVRCLSRVDQGNDSSLFIGKRGEEEEPSHGHERLKMSLRHPLTPYNDADALICVFLRFLLLKSTIEMKEESQNVRHISSDHASDTHKSKVKKSPTDDRTRL